eukprot:COSAG05_NODE_1286_length_5278_cov_4.428461_3_plen_81_part_00
MRACACVCACLCVCVCACVRVAAAAGQVGANLLLEDAASAIAQIRTLSLAHNAMGSEGMLILAAGAPQRTSCSFSCCCLL